MRKSCKAIIEKISIESGLEGGEGNKGAAEAGAQVDVTLEAHDEHTSLEASGLEIPSPPSLRVGRCCCGQRSGPNR